jgi:hypothetical protein
MTKEQLRALAGSIVVVAAPTLTGIVLLHALPKGAHEAAVVLTTLAWQHVGTVIRSLFPGPEIDVTPKGPMP